MSGYVSLRPLPYPQRKEIDTDAINKEERKKNIKTMSRNTDNYTFLTHAPVHKVILSMAVPTIISMLVTSIYGIVDTYYV